MASEYVWQLSDVQDSASGKRFLVDNETKVCVSGVGGGEEEKTHRGTVVALDTTKQNRGVRVCEEGGGPFREIHTTVQMHGHWDGRWD